MISAPFPYEIRMEPILGSFAHHYVVYRFAPHAMVGVGRFRSEAEARNAIAKAIGGARQ